MDPTVVFRCHLHQLLLHLHQHCGRGAVGLAPKELVGLGCIDMPAKIVDRRKRRRGLARDADHRCGTASAGAEGVIEIAGALLPGAARAGPLHWVPGTHRHDLLGEGTQNRVRFFGNDGKQRAGCPVRAAPAVLPSMYRRDVRDRKHARTPPATSLDAAAAWPRPSCPAPSRYSSAARPRLAHGRAPRSSRRSCGDRGGCRATR